MNQILCVDDQQDVALSIQLNLKYCGFDVIIAANGLEGLNRFMSAAGRVCDVISDHHMPYLGGVAFSTNLREMGFRGRIIIVTGELSDALIKQYAGLEICAFIAKPPSIAEIARLFSNPHLMN